MRNAAWVVAVAALFFSGVIGLINGPREFQGMHTPLQFTVAIGVTLYGVLGLIAGFGLALRKLWSVRATEAWGAVVTYVAAVASFAFLPPGTTGWTKAIAATGGGIGAALVAAFVVWAARRATAIQAPTVTADVSEGTP